MRRVRVGLIGAGTIAQSAHLPAMRRLRAELELVAVADIRPEVAERTARRYGAADWYSDYRQILARDDIDLVDICTPEFLHAEQVVAAAEAGKHVLCEKPIAATLDEADAMIAAARAAGTLLMIGHSRRFTPRYQLIRRAIDRGDIGEVRLVRENERRAASMYSVMPDWQGYWSPEGDQSWMVNPAYSQGAALTNAVHEMDLARWFVGSEATSVYAEARATDPDAAVPDFLTYTITFANGAIAAAEVVNGLPAAYPYFHMMEVFGTEGLIQATDPPMSPLESWSAQGMRFPSNFNELLHVDDAYVEEIRSVVASVRDGVPLPLDPWDARQALALSLAAVESSRTGRVVELGASADAGGA